ncbi:ryanodine receptor-like protein, partial [Dinothrombium tinctorium]
MVCLQSTATGTRICLAAEGFGNRHCFLENIADKNFPTELASCVFVIEQALSVRALQEMVTAESQGEAEGGSTGKSSGGSRTLLYGHAVLLRHGHSKMYLACLSSGGTSSDKLAFDVGLQEHSQGEACWWTVHPASKQRSEGEKVRVGDEIILVSVATERYLHTAKESEKSIVDASFKLTHWSVAPFGTGLSRTKNVGFVFGGDVLRFYHGGDECLTIPANWSDAPGQNLVIYEGGAVMSQARSLWRLELIRTKWAGGFINWGYPLRIHHITTGRYLGANENHEIILISREMATVAETAFYLRQNKDDKKIILDEKEEEVIGSPLIKYGDTSFFLQHIETGFWLSYKSYETKKRGVGRVEEKQAILSEEGKMDDGLEFSRSQEEEAKTARVIRKCGIMFNKFIRVLDSLHETRFCHIQRQGSSRSVGGGGVSGGSTINVHSPSMRPMMTQSDQEEMVMCLEDLIAYFAQPEEDIDHEEKQNKLKALRNRQDLFQEEGILNLILETIDKINLITTQGLLGILLGGESSSTWDAISAYLYQLLAAIIKGNHTNCAQFAQAHRLDWLFSRLSSQSTGEGSGMLDVLHCVLTDSPEALNMMKDNHIRVIVSLLEKHGRDPKVLDVLCSLCVGNGVAVRSSQNNICDNLCENLLLQTRLVDHVTSMRPNIYVGKVERSAMYRRWYYELTIDHIESVTHLRPHFRVGWANTVGYVPYPGGGFKWGGNGVGDDLFSYGFDGCSFWTGGRSNQVRSVADDENFLRKNDVVGCILDLNIPLITFTVNGIPVRGCFKGFNTDGMFYPVISFSAKYSCRFLFGGDHGRLKFGPPHGHSAYHEALLPGQYLQVEPCFQFGELSKNILLGPALELTAEAAFVPHPVDTSGITLPHYIENIRDKLAENIHEVWAMNKIEGNWTYGEVRDNVNMKHPCLTSFERLPASEKKYDIALALQTLKTIVALGYRISMDKPPGRIKMVRLPNDPYLQSNGYKPAPLDLSQIELTPKMEELVELLAENTHNVWASERISQNWTYGLSEDYGDRRNPHLVPYRYVDEVIKQTNRETAAQTVKTLLAYGYVLEAPTGEASEIDALLGRETKTKYDFRSFRAEKTYAITSGKWYFEVEILSNGPIKVGWATLEFKPNFELGNDDYSWAFDCNGSRKFHAGNSEAFGKTINIGDIVGCMLDIDDKTISYSLNGELLLDAGGGEMAFTDINGGDTGFVPALTLGIGQKVRLILGQDVNALKCFTTCGLQEGYQPFCVNMNRNMTFWYNKDEPVFVNVEDCASHIEITRAPGGSDTPPVIKITHKLFETQEKASWEFLRLSLPVITNNELIDDNIKQMKWEEIRQRQKRMEIEQAVLRHPAKLEQHMLDSGFSLSDVKELQRAYSEDGGEEVESPQPRPGSPWATGVGPRKQPSLTKTKSFDNTLTVPSITEAQQRMRETGGGLAAKRSTSVEALDRQKDQEDGRKKRGKSPFKLFGRKEHHPTSKTTRTQEVEPPTISVLAGSTAQLVPPAVPERPSNLRPRERSPAPMLARRGSRVPIPDSLPDEASDLLDPSCLDLVDEYFYGVRIFPGQDPSHVYCGWVISNFKCYEKTFDSSKVRKVTLQVWGEDGHLAEYCDRQNCYMLNAGKLYSDVNEKEESGGRSNQGMFVGCHVDVATGTLTFTADGKATRYRFRLEPGTQLFPAVFFEATTKECIQFELGRTPTTLPLSAAILKSTSKHLTPQCPPRLKVQSLQPYQWARVPNVSLKPHALKLSDIRGWSMLVDDPVSMLALYIPEEDRCLDILELIENEKLLVFHAETLRLYGALCFQGNTRAAHMICINVDEKQLMYAIKSEYMSGLLRTGFADLLISLHLESFAYARSLNQHEFIVPLGKELKELYNENSNIGNSISTLLCASIRPMMKQSQKLEKVESVKGLSSPYFPLDLLKQFVMEAFDDAVKKSNRPMRDPIGGSNTNLFVPIIKLLDKLLLIDCIDDSDLEWLLKLIDFEIFDPDYNPENEIKVKGLMDMSIDEGVKLELCYLLHHLYDLQLRHRVESVIAFSDQYVGDLQTDQLRRYLSVKQEDLPAALAAKKTREFRCAPKEQMRIILGFKNFEEDQMENCPITEDMRNLLFSFHGDLMRKVKIDNENEGEEETTNMKADDEKKSWSKKLMTFIKKVKAASERGSQQENFYPISKEEIFRKKVVSTVIKWAEEYEIENRELIRQMFYLLLRSYNGVGEIMAALENTYVHSPTSKEDVSGLLEHLGIIRSLLPVQMSTEEEEIVRATLWTLVMNRVFFQHPDLIQILRAHENVMHIMTNTLSRRAQKESSGSEAAGTQQTTSPATQTNQNQEPATGQEQSQHMATGDTSAMVVACCRFLCYFCRSSSRNQKAMFQHLNFLLENSNILLSRPSLRGSTPLDVASSSVMENPELALALRENYLEKIAVYLSRCGLQSNQELLDQGYPDIGWDPVGGERFLDFFRTCVWVNGESVEENANLVIRLLIRRPECLGPALRGEGEGLLQAIKDSITMSDNISAEREAKIQRGEITNVEEDEDYIDMGAAVLSFYCGLVDLLGRCAPEATTIALGKNECIRARAILRSLVPMEDLEGVLALRFALKEPSQVDSSKDLPSCFLPQHKQSIVLFLERVYGIDNQETFFRLLEDAFLPDLRAATMLERNNGSDSEMVLALNRYLGNAVLPLLIKYSNYFGDADNWASLMDATLHTVYRLSKVKVLTKGQRECVSDFLVALTHEMQPSMLLGLLRKLTVDVSVLSEYSSVALRLLTLHYDRCSKYYGQGGQGGYGTASEEERKLTMLLFSNIFDSLAKMEYDPDLFSKALPCLTAIACALPPDYSLTTSSDDSLLKSGPTDGPYLPNPVDISSISLSADLLNIVQKFSEHYHDAWASRKFENGWTYGEPWSYERKIHPRLKPYHRLTDYERSRYKEPIADVIKTLLALGWKLEQTDQSQVLTSRSNSRQDSRQGAISDYNPQPVDMSSLTLSRELQTMAERLAENAHEIWAKQTLSSVGGALHPQMVPYDLLTDKEKKKNRERSQELLKFLQYEGFRVYKTDDSYSNPSEKRIDRSGGKAGNEEVGEGERERGHSEMRFASSLLTRLLQYLETATISLKLLKPSANFSRRSSFRQTSRDIKFFSKVVLPLVEKLFSAHRTFFLTSSQLSAGSSTIAGGATAKEKEMIASLFCQLSELLRTRFSVMSPDAKLCVRCLQVLIRATDARTVVKNSPDFVKTVWLTFFNHCADDLANCVSNLQNSKFSHIRGTTMKTSSSLNYIQLVLIPVLTALFDHLASNDFGADLLVNDIQVACYKILHSLGTLGTSNLTLDRKFIKAELDFHRPSIGNCLGAFAATFPVAFLEPHLNKNNKNCIHSKSQEYSLEAQAVMQELEASMPTLDDLMSKFEKYVENEVKYSKEPQIVDVTLLMLCAYLPFWWNQGVENTGASSENIVTMVTSDHLNRMLKSILTLVKNTVGHPGHPWMVTLAAHAGMIIINSSEELLKDPILPLAQKIRQTAEKVYHREDVLKGFLKSQSDETSELETQLQEEYALLVRDIYAFYPLLIKYVDIQRSHWLKNNVPEAEELYHCIASIFNVWSKSQYFRKEEQNFISANEIDNMALIMPSTGRSGRPVITKGDGQVGGVSKVKKKKRDGKRDREKELASSLMVSALKRLLPVGLNLFAGREQELVQFAKDRILKKENESIIFDTVRLRLNLPDKIDPSDAMSWQHYLYSKLGKSEDTSITGKEIVAQQQQQQQHLKPEDREKQQELLVHRIIDMAKVLFGLHMAKKPQARKGAWFSVISNHRKRVVIACLSSPPLYTIKRHRAMNLFLRIYNELWLDEENVGQERLIEDLTQSFEEHEQKKGTEEAEEQKPDPLIQLVTTLSRKATTEHGAAMKEDTLFMEFAYIFSQSCGGAEEEEEEGGEEEEASIHEQELEKQKLLFQQARLADRGVAEMVLLYISACKGIQSPMAIKTLKLGISILRGGNSDVQKRMITHLKEKKDVGFFTSIAGLMNSCSVLDLDAFERNQKAEGLGVGSEGTAGEKNMHDADFTCVLFRFIQLLCEGHNLDFQNYLRTQAGNTTTVNVIIITVDYLLRLQESMMDFYWHYSSKEIIDPSGKENFCKAITVAKQVFSTLTESIQGPCQGNQQALAHSRLWDAVGGFFFLFAHMQDKLSKNASQLDLLIELLDLQKEMVVMMLSMLEGNVVNGTIGRQMVDTLVESAANVEIILKFFDMFLKLKQLTSSSSFQEIDKKQIGWVTAKDFKKAMEQQKIYSAEEIDYLMSCCEPNHDGLIDYIEFTERFHGPAKEIGFNLAVLLTNLSEHMPSDPRLQRFLEIASSVLTYFEPYLGRIEIMGSAKRVERVYFEIKESSINQWEKPQIKESKRAFFYSVVTEGGDKEKLELFVDFCEDAIFEMQHAAMISMDKEEEPTSSREYPFLGEEEKPPSILDPLWKLLGVIWNKFKKILSLMTPTNIKKQLTLIKEQTPGELALGLIKLILNSFVFGGSFTYSVTSYILRFILRLMTGEPITGSVVEEEEEPTKALVHISPFSIPEYASPPPSVLAIEAPPIPATTEEITPTSNGVTHIPGEQTKEVPSDAEKVLETSKVASEQIEETKTIPAQEVKSIKKEEEKLTPDSVPEEVEEEMGEQSKAEQPVPILSSFSISDYAHRFICFLARNFYTMKYIALMIAFIINFILLFYKVTESVTNGEDSTESIGSGSGSGSGSGELFDSGSEAVNDILGSGDGEEGDEDKVEEWIAIEAKLFYLIPILRMLAIIHACFSFCMLIGYYYLKLPLAIFKREKEIARSMEFEGLYIAEPAGEDNIKAHWDKLVISTHSFPGNYWDKFVKKKVREKYSEQYDYDQISNLLGMDKGFVAEKEESKSWFSTLTNVDWKYQIWKAGVTITDNSFLYNLWYFSFSLLGNFNYFFFAAHLLDIAVGFKTLRTILQSVTHNGKQLVLTVMFLTIMVYIYTVIAFNFFRKFYVSGEDDEADKKCNSMLTCFIFNIYQGVRAGGGIGDVIEPPDGDDYEVYRIIFDITFFFFIIVILLAIIQGLIIDAFGELRDQLQSVVDDMEANCFICGIGKDYFDKIPHGFETHVMKEHNLANYLFFLMHLINKPDTDYTGQETYVWELYQKRCWDFFPV